MENLVSKVVKTETGKINQYYINNILNITISSPGKKMRFPSICIEK